ncbi:NUDIX domain-containing protein [Mucilaginibacter sp. L196]|uniref:NUDIX hydrolase n=1 Tax=Mucilaginibacter sp. L196 TaxID=1641870 RepID=UPI00131EB05D|nr:NUDIX domain-containing protein [Mucilaginibacter sp. L196]
MISERVLKNSEELWATCIPHLSVDNVVFGFHDTQLKVLLLQINEGKDWILPGGYVRKNENVNDAVKRVLKERTGADNIFLQQFATFGDVNRSEAFFTDYPDDLWHKQRFISTSYYALVDYTAVVPVTDEFSDACKWVNVEEIPNLVMDHTSILKKALEVLREQLIYKPIGYSLLPEEFTLTELQRLYEAILGIKLNRGNFYRRVMKFGILIKSDNVRRGGAHKAPDLYRFDQTKYHESLKSYSW